MSRTNAIRVAATGGRVVVGEGVVANIGVATSTTGEQRTRRTLVGDRSVVFGTALVDARAGESAATTVTIRDPLATHQTTSVVPLGRNRHLCSA